jgi:hypothetical protein
MPTPNWSYIEKKNHLFFLLFISTTSKYMLFLLCLVMDQSHRAQQASKPSSLRIDLSNLLLKDLKNEIRAKIYSESSLYLYIKKYLALFG